MSKKLSTIFDNGHGSTINGVYQTEGKRSPDWAKGVLYEGVANRWIVNKVIHKMDYARLPYYHVSPELEDISLTERVRRADKIFAVNPNTFGVSVHFNAAGGTGWEIFTSPGVTQADNIAAEFIDVFKSAMPIKFRPGGTGALNEDKEEKFTMVTGPKAPFVLLELGFMDNPNDYELIWNPNFQDLLADLIFKSIQRVNEKYGK